MTRCELCDVKLKNSGEALEKHRQEVHPLHFNFPKTESQFCSFSTPTMSTPPACEMRRRSAREKRPSFKAEEALANNVSHADDVHEDSVIIVDKDDSEYIPEIKEFDGNDSIQAAGMESETKTGVIAEAGGDQTNTEVKTETELENASESNMIAEVETKVIETIEAIETSSEVVTATAAEVITDLEAKTIATVETGAGIEPDSPSVEEEELVETKTSIASNTKVTAETETDNEVEDGTGSKTNTENIENIENSSDNEVENEDGVKTNADVKTGPGVCTEESKMITDIGTDALGETSTEANTLQTSSAKDNSRALLDADIKDGNENQEDTTIKMKGLLVRNLAETVTKNELINILGFNASDYSKFFCSCKVNTNKQEKNAVLFAPSHISAEIAKLDGIELHNQPTHH